MEQALNGRFPHLAVVTTNDYAAHLAWREKLYIIGFPSQREAHTDPDIVFLNPYNQQYIAFVMAIGNTFHSLILNV